MTNCELFEHPCSRVSVCLGACVWRVWIRNVKHTSIYYPESWIRLSASLSSQNTFANQRKTLKWRGVASVYLSFSEKEVASVARWRNITFFVPLKKAWPLFVSDNEGHVASVCPSEGAGSVPVGPSDGGVSSMLAVFLWERRSFWHFKSNTALYKMLCVKRRAMEKLRHKREDSVLLA